MSTNGTDTVGQESSSESIANRTVDWESGDEPVLTVVNAVATVTETDPTEMEPLSSTVDADALAALFNAGKNQNGHVQFEYENCRVRLEANGRVSVMPLDG